MQEKMKLAKHLLPLALPIAFFLILPISIPSYAMYVLTLCFYYSTLATSYNLVAGYAGQINFGQAAILGVGCYTSALLSVDLGLPTPITVLIGGIIAVIAGVGIALLTLRVKGPYFILVTLTIGEVLRVIIINEWQITHGLMGIRTPPIAGITSNGFYYYLMFLIMMIAVVVLYKIERSSFGLSLKAIREDEGAASVMGVNTLRQKIVAFAISCFFAGICGAFIAHYLRVAAPDLFSMTEMVIILASCMIGGSGTLLGPIIGAFLYEGLYELMRPLIRAGYQGLNLIVFATILVVIIAFAPRGIWPLIKRGWAWMQALQ